MIWATVSSRSCFCWLYRASPSLPAKNIINLILIFWYWPSGNVHVSSLLLYCWKMVFALMSVFSWQNSISLCPASFCTPRPNFPVTPGICWLPTFAFQSPMMKWHVFQGLVLKGLVGLHRTIQLQLLWHYWIGHRFELLNGLPWKWTEIILLYLMLHPSIAFLTLILILTMWWCPCVKSSLVLLEEGVCYD